MTLIDSLAVAVLKGDKVAMFALLDAVQELREKEPSTSMTIATETTTLNDILEKASVRLANVIEIEGISTLGELLSRTPRDMLGVRNFGQVSLRELREILAGYGLHLRSDKDNPFYLATNEKSNGNN